MAILPISALHAQTAEEQIDAIYAAADEPGAERIRATQLARLAGNLMRRLPEED